MRGGHRLLGGRTTALGHSRGDGRQRRRMQWVRGGHPLEGGQREFALIVRTRAQASHRDAPAAERDMAGGAAAARGAPTFVGHALGAAQRDAVGFDHGDQHALTSVDAKTRKA